MLKTYQFQIHCKGDSHSSKTANIIQAKYSTGIGYSTWVRCFNQHNAQFNEFEYHFACRRKVVHLCFITSPGKMIFSVLEL